MSARRKLTADPERKSAKFSAETFEKLADDMQSGRTPLPRVTISDDQVGGLRAVIRNTGLISFHVHYDHDGSRPFMKIGDHPEMKVEDARKIARTIHSLSEKGIDVQSGLHERLMRELKEKGDEWRP